jgi:DnaK suppressor protein
MHYEQHPDDFLLEMRKSVLAEAATVRARLEDTATTEEDEDLVEDVDIATTTQARAFAHQMRVRDQLYLQKLLAAEKRILSKHYGICRICEELVPEARLRARPCADTHVECKAEEEKAAKGRSIRVESSHEEV